MFVYSNKDFIEDCAKYIAEHPNAIALLPTQSYITPLKNFILKHTKNTIELPKILTIEGIDVSSVIDCNEEFLSRNVVFGILYNLTKTCNVLQEEDIPIFVRSILGELPNLYAHKITADDIINNIPASISMKYEINIALFTKIWKAFEVFLCEAKLLPYYTKQTIFLEKLLDYASSNSIHLVIVNDFGSSPILRNFIEKASKRNINAALFQGKKEKNVNTYMVKTPHHVEQKTVLLTTKYILGNDNNAKIGIVCEDEVLKAMISIELENENINHYVNLSVSLESNPFIRFFLCCINKISLLEILPQLNIENTTKHQILISELNSTTIDCKKWNEITQIYTAKFLNYIEYITNILSFLTTKSHYFIFSSNEYTDFLQFKNFILNEIEALTCFNISPNKDFIKNIINSWKIFEKKQDSNIMILPLKNVHLFTFDTIILTSGYKMEVQGNVIFSNGMRHYYGFASKDLTNDFLQNITSSIFCTSDKIFELQTQPLFLTEELKFFNKKYERPHISILDNETPKQISATAIETLFTNPLNYYYKYIKFLKPVEYCKQKTLEVGNIVHKVLENLTLKIINQENINPRLYTIQHFKEKKLQAMVPFYLDGIIQEYMLIQNIIHNGGQIECEKNFSYNIKVQNYDFEITSRADRIDTIQNNITIYDYKTSSSEKFEKNFQKMEKIQILIPALCFSNYEIDGVYKFIGNNQIIKQKIENELLNTLIEKIQDALSKYFVHKEVLECGEGFYAYQHIARI